MTSSASRRDDPIELARRNWDDEGWSAATDGMALVTSIMRLQQIMLAEVERVLRPFGLTFARYEVLMLLHFSRRGELPVGKIGERLQVHPASVTNAVARLELDGWVRRSQNPADRRGVLAAITDAGRERALAATAQLNDEVFGPVGRQAAGYASATVLVDHLREWRRAYDRFD